ncbi:MAG: sce7726 family protein [Aliidongia sp.]
MPGCATNIFIAPSVTQKILMGKHSLRTASMLNEFRAGSCKADLVILNGTATVYEIKSERDSLTRLANLGRELHARVSRR